MKASVTFEFDQEHDLAYVAQRINEVAAYARLISALHDIWTAFRNKEKYGDSETITLEEARTIIQEAINNHDVASIVHG